jgi:hypothetical protein
MAHNKTLTELKWFKWALWGPIGVAVIITAIITGFDNYPQPLDWGLSSDHINEAISRLKFPIAIASLAFPLVALVASHHRSVQTAAQIERTDNQILRTDIQLERTSKQISLTEDKNSFDNNIRHREFFSKQLELLEKRFDIKFKSHFEIYEAIFLSNDYHNFQANADDMSRACRLQEDILRDTENFDEGTFFFNVEKSIRKINSHALLLKNSDSEYSLFEDIIDMLIYNLTIVEISGVKITTSREALKYYSLDGRLFLPSCRHFLYVIDGVLHNLMVMSFSKSRLMDMDIKKSILSIDSDIYYKMIKNRKEVYRFDSTGRCFKKSNFMAGSGFISKKLKRWNSLKKSLPL